MLTNLYMGAPYTVHVHVHYKYITTLQVCLSTKTDSETDTCMYVCMHRTSTCIHNVLVQYNFKCCIHVYTGTCTVQYVYCVQCTVHACTCTCTYIINCQKYVLCTCTVHVHTVVSVRHSMSI